MHSPFYQKQQLRWVSVNSDGAVTVVFCFCKTNTLKKQKMSDDDRALTHLGRRDYIKIVSKN
jgi:hypothetical protein